MTGNRYYKKDWEESYYIFDSNTISEEEFDEKVQYEDYKAFEDSMMGDEVVDTLNEQEDLISELYLFRLIYNALLFNEWYKKGKYEVYKSKRHHDGSIPFDDENWFIVVAILPTGQISNHYHIRYWDEFQIPEVEKVKHEFDGHTSKDVWDRLMEVLYD